MRRCVPRGLISCGGDVAAPSIVAALLVAHRTPVSIGGRASRPGFAEPQGKAPRVKQGTSRDVPQRIPGTTKVRYTNQRGRTFTFSIPVSQLTHPPVNRRGASAAGWQEIDTSFSDVGDLEDDMPTELDEHLAAVGVQSEGGTVVEVNAEQLRGLQASFVLLCRDYVLMDTTGMKTSMTYNELNTGPDYEHYDRKARRRRHWIALRHRFEDVRELLWPSDAAAEMRHQREETAAIVEKAGVAEHQQKEITPRVPLLSLPAMMEALSWAEAASTFAVRTHRPYDAAPAVEFTPLDLSREVRVVAECIAAAGPSALLDTSELYLSSPALEKASTLTSGADLNERNSNMDTQRAATDRFISFAALCTNHKVPLSVAFASPSATSASLGTATAGVQTWLTTLPALSRVKDAIRVMSVLQSIDDASEEQPIGNTSQALKFSNAEGMVVNSELLLALCRIFSYSLFPHVAALENVDEGELCILMRFVAELQEQNAAYFSRADLAISQGGGAFEAHNVERQTLLHLTQLSIARCRQLLYKTGGPRASLMSGDEENIPFVDLQAFAEHSHPEVRVHGKIGESNAQGLRYAKLQPPASAALAQLLSRIEEVNSGLTTCTRTLRMDLLQHIAHKAALGKAKLTLEDVKRALPLLAGLMHQMPEDQVKKKFDRLFAAISTCIGVRLQQAQKPSTVLELLEGLADCHYVPTSYKPLEMVTLRLLMGGSFSLGEVARALLSLLRIVGPHGVSQSVQQAVAMRVVAELEKAPEEDIQVGATAAGSAATVMTDVLEVLRALRFSLYPSFPSLMLLVAKSKLMSVETQRWQPGEHVRYAVLLTAAAGRLSLLEEDTEVVSSLTKRAREELHLGLSVDGSSANTEAAAFSAINTAVCALDGEDGHQECLVTCAALQLEVTPAVLETWARTALPDAEERPRHSLCTPLLAVGTLEAMEALHLAPSDWYTTYDTYLSHTLEQILKEKVRDPQQGLLEDDAQTAERTLYLSRVSPVARAAAAALLEGEVERLDATLNAGSIGVSNNSGDAFSCSLACGTTASPAKVNSQPVFTFQQKALSRQTEIAALEDQLLRYCVALKHQQQQTVETEAPNMAS